MKQRRRYRGTSYKPIHHPRQKPPKNTKSLTKRHSTYSFIPPQYDGENYAKQQDTNREKRKVGTAYKPSNKGRNRVMDHELLGERKGLSVH
jgi:hypothetical protein